MVQIAYIGLGKIGFEVAIHIAHALERSGEQPLLVYNRTSSKTEELATTTPHTEVATTLDLIAQQADIIFSCLFDDASVKTTFDPSFLERLKPGCILVSQATIAPETAYDMAKLTATYGHTYVSCPVMGVPEKAKQGQLIALLSGGSATVRQQLIPYIDQVFSKKVIQVGGDDVGAALRLKLCGNYFIFQLIESVAEGLTLGEAAPGVGEGAVKQLIDALFPNTSYVDYSQRMVDQTYLQPAKFSIDGGLKDASHILALGDQVGLQLPTTKAFKQHLNTLKQERPETDISGIVRGKSGRIIAVRLMIIHSSLSFIAVVRQSAGLDSDLI
jgi:3-hydroxyisobutyrate dehydrogenase-like beta-hydroxyacid dehydrogenase